MSELEALRAERTRFGQRGAGQEIPEPLRSRMCAAAARARQAGVSDRAIAYALGVAPSTASKLAGVGAAQVGSVLRPVTVAEQRSGSSEQARESSRVDVVSPGGWRVEGLTVDDVARLLASGVLR